MTKDKLEALLGRRVTAVEPMGLGKLKVRYEDGSLWEVSGTMTLGGVCQVWDLQSATEIIKCPPHKWDASGERCMNCGDKDWMN